MRNPVSPLVANIFMDSLKYKIFNSDKSKFVEWALWR